MEGLEIARGRRGPLDGRKNFHAPVAVWKFPGLLIVGSRADKAPDIGQEVGLEIWGRFGSHPAEAIAAVDGAVTPRPERDHGIVSAFGADDGVHFTRPVLVHSATATATTTATAALFRSAYCPATAATLGLVAKAPGLEEFLFPNGEDELAATLHADQGLVRQCHWEPPGHTQVLGDGLCGPTGQPTAGGTKILPENCEYLSQWTLPVRIQTL